MKSLLRHWFRRRESRDPNPEVLQKTLVDWCHSDVGRYLLEAEQRMLDGHLSGTAGYRAMLLKGMAVACNIEAGAQLHKFVLAPGAGEDVSTVSHSDALPLPSDVVELAVLHHVLDFTEYPHESLKESSRVVQASGHLVIIGFNPWGWFGLWRLCGRLFSSAPLWQSRCLSVGRVTDWLKLVGFQPEKVTYGGFRPPIMSPRLLVKLAFMDRLLGRFRNPMGNFYVITARKVRLRPLSGKQEWLAQAIKPAKLISRTQAKKGSHREKC